jgi:glycosyltransferase involved in cell wall biosynthesis
VNRILAEESPDVYISLSSSEDIPHSMLEALSYGIPVISTDVGGVSEVIKNGENGFLLPADPGSKEVAELLRQITTIDEAAWLQMRHNALDTWHLMADATKQYQELCYLLLQMSRNYEQ